MRHQPLAIVALLCLSTLSSAEGMQDFEAGWYVQGGVYTHYREDEDYEGPPLFGGIEYLQTPKLLWGFSMFENSFGQFSQYAYIGRSFHPFGNHPDLRVKITGGIVRGYSGDHHKILPLRWSGKWGIGAIPTIGYQKDNIGYDVAFLSTSGLLFLAGYRFD